MNIQDTKRLEELNKAVEEALENRKKWLDLKMNEYSKLKVGDILYNVKTGIPLGRITKIYRFCRDNFKGIYDTSLDYNYEYYVGKNTYDNTSHQPGLFYGTKEDVVKYHRNLVNNL